MSPELINGRVYSQASDLWSAGVVLYILLSGKMPFYGNSPVQTKQRIRDCDYSLTKPVWDEVSDSAKDLVRKLIEVVRLTILPLYNNISYIQVHT